METLNILIAVLLLLSAIGGAWLTRQNKRQQAEIDRLNGEVFDAEVSASTEADRRYWQGYYDCDATWKGKPMYVTGYQAALVEQAGAACEMEELRKSGELGQTVKELSAA